MPNISFPRPILFALSLFFLACLSCGKTTISLPPEEQLVRNLTGAGNRLWMIRELYINGTSQSLTAFQLSYWKTYTIAFGNPEARNGTFADQQGYKGSWSVVDANNFKEQIENTPNGQLIVLPMHLNKLTSNEMDVEYTANGITTRTVYFAN